MLLVVLWLVLLYGKNSSSNFYIKKEIKENCGFNVVVEKGQFLFVLLTNHVTDCKCPSIYITLKRERRLLNFFKLKENEHNKLKRKKHTMLVLLKEQDTETKKTSPQWHSWNDIHTYKIYYMI